MLEKKCWCGAFRTIFTRKDNNMTIRVGINGFGRIGRLVFRAAQKRDDIEIVGINDLIDVEYMAYMLRYDTMHGRFDGTVEVKDGKITLDIAPYDFAVIEVTGNAND